MPQFQSGGAYNAIQQFLMQREMQNRQRMLDELTRQRESDDRNQRGLDQMQRDFQNQRVVEGDRMDAEDRQRRIDAEATQARAAQNTVGVRGMMADAMTEGEITPDARRTLGIMAFREGMDVPPQIAAMDAEEADARKRSQALADREAEAMIDASVQPAGERFRTVGGSIFDTENETFRTPPQQGGGSSRGGTAPAASGGGRDASTEYGIQTADRVIAAIDGVLPKINERTAGILGSATTRLGINQEGIDVSSELDTVAGNIAFNALQQMRAASKTGGALGNVANQELNLLKGIEGSIRQDQSPANLRAQLTKVRESMERFKAAQAMGGDLNMGRTSDPAKPTAADLIRKYGGR